MAGYILGFEPRGVFQNCLQHHRTPRGRYYGTKQYIATQHMFGEANLAFVSEEAVELRTARTSTDSP